MPKVNDVGDISSRRTFELYGNDTDFMVNEALDGFFGNDMLANEQFEEIPFQLSFDEEDQDPTPEGTAIYGFQWRPDPALYVAMMAGLVEIQFDALSIDGLADRLDIQLAIHVAGWSSIMGDPDKKTKNRSKRTTRGRRKSKK